MSTWEIWIIWFFFFCNTATYWNYVHLQSLVGHPFLPTKIHIHPYHMPLIQQRVMVSLELTPLSTGHRGVGTSRMDCWLSTTTFCQSFCKAFISTDMFKSKPLNCASSSSSKYLSGTGWQGAWGLSKEVQGTWQGLCCLGCQFVMGHTWAYTVGDLETPVQLNTYVWTMGLNQSNCRKRGENMSTKYGGAI